MFYCEPCGQVRNWPTLGMKSRGPCEMCDEVSDCFDVPSHALPFTPYIAKGRYASSPKPVRARDRVDDFMDLFSTEEKKSWKGQHSRTPKWVLEGILFFLNTDVAHQELMRRLKESGD